ncbi:hypothetical protein Hamer_G014906, partial [Homarus americanus]
TRSQTLRNKVQTVPSVDPKLCIADSSAPGNDENDLGIESLFDSLDDSFDSDIGGSDLVSSYVTIGVKDFLPVLGVTFFLGYDLAGSKVIPQPVVFPIPLPHNLTEQLEE